ncbi:phosphatidate cytidylyltransferase [Actinorugispora endophytica]|uniref:Phosphatidate cytidylyltransferase n=1 Tax=Actinorugispora endophytica TaxID=1605990 RepID=A0A4R6V0Z8_9ACTN|nr:phosphatidate cytidylyltransferase [Actinorugispora endophytica]TDQ53705.1 phosphatidate cytidylyltransferase [Actinorugispora endophytica]
MSNSESSEGAPPEQRPGGASPQGGTGPGENGAADSNGRRFTLHKPDGQPVRTGRNLPLAIGSGVALGALAFAAIMPYPPLFTVITSIAVVLGVRELRRAFASRGIRMALPPVVAGGVAIQGAAFFGGPIWLVGALALAAILTLAWRLRGGAEGYVRDSAASLFSLLYLPFLLSTWLLLLAAPDDGRLRLIAFIIVTISSDIGGYFAGILLGRHKMAPVISPNKTWEGFAGSVLGCMIAGGVTVGLMLDGPVWAGLVLGVAVVLAATVGDLIESLVKRDFGIKDMGSFMPGHGGLLDRVDSLLIAGPVAWMVLTLLVPSAG